MLVESHIIWFIAAERLLIVCNILQLWCAFRSEFLTSYKWSKVSSYVDLAGLWRTNYLQRIAAKKPGPFVGDRTTIQLRSAILRKHTKASLEQWTNALNSEQLECILLTPRISQLQVVIMVVASCCFETLAFVWCCGCCFWRRLRRSVGSGMARIETSK